MSVSKYHGRIDVEVVEGNCTLRGAHGDVYVAEVSGALDAARGHGRVRLRAARGAVSVRNSHGNIEVAPAAPIQAPYRLDAQHGDLRLTVPAGSQVDLRARAERGSVTSNLALEVSKRGHDATATLSRGPVPVELSARYGRIQVWFDVPERRSPSDEWGRRWGMTLPGDE